MDYIAHVLKTINESKTESSPTKEDVLKAIEQHNNTCERLKRYADFEKTVSIDCLIVELFVSVAYIGPSYP